MYRVVLFDIDGTLVDSNDAHARAWVEAFAGAGVTVEFAKVRRAIGMGGDKLLPQVSGIEEDSDLGKRISKQRQQIFKEKYLPNLKPFPRSRELVAEMKARRMTTVAASSAKRDELDPLLEIAGASQLFDETTSSDDVEESKPDPDILHVALKKAKALPQDAVMIGDTPYDVEAAARAGVAMIALRCGGWNDTELTGAIAIYNDPADLLARIDSSPLSRSW